jgi:FAD/FMN-containing dehydrogenase
VNGRGEVVDLDQESAPDLFPSTQISLGALGIVTSVTIRIEPHYSLRIERGASQLETLLANLNSHVHENRNFEFFWFPRSGLAYTKRMNRVDNGTNLRSSMLSRSVRFVNDVVVENFIVWIACETTLRYPSLRQRWLALATRLVPHDVNTAPAERCYATPRLVRHYETEYALPITQAASVLTALDEALCSHPVKTMIPIEVRFAKGEPMPLSVTQGSDVMHVAVHAYHREDYLELFDLCEEIFLKFGGRPHWGKMHSLKAEDLKASYPRWKEFQSARQVLDPSGVFMNGYLRRVLGKLPESNEIETSKIDAL